MISGATRFPQAAVVGDSEASDHSLALAEQTGEMLARRGITLVTGGGGGLMEAATRGARQAGGLTLGITPGTDMTSANPWCNIVIPTGLGHARNVLTALASDFIVAIGGGAGTLSELCFGWVHGRASYVLEGAGGWSDRLALDTLDHRGSAVIVTCYNVEALEHEVERYCATKDLTIRGSYTKRG